MTEAENESVEEQSSMATAQADESESTQTERQNQEALEQRKRNDAEYNWAEVRRQMKEKDQKIEKLEEQFASFNRKAPALEEDELSKLAEDDILTVAQARKLASKMAKSAAEDVFKQREAATVDERVKLKFSDYDEVVNKDNIELLKQTEPELAWSLSQNPDPYNQAVAAYKLLKKIVPAKENSMPLEKKKAMENAQKPQSVQAAAKSSAFSDLNQFADMDRKTKEAFLKSKYEEMQKAMKYG